VFFVLVPVLSERSSSSIVREFEDEDEDEDDSAARGFGARPRRAFDNFGRPPTILITLALRP